MFRLLPVLIFLFTQATFAEERCEEMFVPQDLRIELGHSDLKLTPLTKVHAESLRQLLSDKDVSRFFVGRDASIEELVLRHLDRAARITGGVRDSYDGIWIITENGKVGGYLMMSAVDSTWLPLDIQAQFQKARPEDLYLVVGYALDPTFRGRGIASRALNLALEFARSTLRAKFVFASANNSNPASSNVLSRGGFLPVFSDPTRTKFLLRLE